MAVEAQASGERQLVAVTWDKSIVSGEIVQLYCVNPDNGDVSVSGLSKNDGQGGVSFPLGYSGTSEITVYDNDGNADFGVITVGEDGEVESPPEVTDPVFPTNPIVLPPDSGLEPANPIVLPGDGEGGEPPEASQGPGFPTNPIVLPPDAFPVNPIFPGGPPPEATIPIFPSNPIVIPPGLGDGFWTGNLPPAAGPV